MHGPSHREWKGLSTIIGATFVVIRVVEGQHLGLASPNDCLEAGVVPSSRHTQRPLVFLPDPLLPIGAPDLDLAGVD